jgi:hypothetical protein
MPKQPRPARPSRPRPWPLGPRGSLLERVDLERLKTRAPKLSTLPPEPLPPHVVAFPGGQYGVTSGLAVSADGRAMGALASHVLSKALVWSGNR